MNESSGSTSGVYFANIMTKTLVHLLWKQILLVKMIKCDSFNILKNFLILLQ